jgi:hypothetical protein
MVFRHKINLLQRLFLKKSICTIVFACLFSVMRMSANNDEIDSHAKDEIIEKLKTDVEFKNLVEKIYDLIVNQHSTDDIIKIIDDPLKKSYDIQKLAQNIHDLLNRQNSKSNIINIIVENNKKAEEYSLNKKAKTIYVLLKIIALASAVMSIYYLLSQYFEFPFFGKFGVEPSFINESSEDKTNNEETFDKEDSGYSSPMDEQLQNYMVNKLHFDIYAADLVKEQIEMLKCENFITEQDCKGLFKCENEESKFFKMTLEEQIACARKMGLI